LPFRRTTQARRVHAAATYRKKIAKHKQILVVDCGYENHADVVGAINILSRGMQYRRRAGQGGRFLQAQSAAQIACEVNGAVMPSATEPTEATAQNHRAAL
jgi:putative transposase